MNNNFTEFKKIDYSEYKDKYDERVKEKLHATPTEIDIESLRAYIYGYTFTEDYAKGIFPDELSMDYWRDECEDILDDVTTIQEIRILEAIDSTGDGKTPETALCVIDVGQEYEYLSRVFPYYQLKMVCQSVSKGIDCLEFEPNAYGVERIYFDMRRRFEVGYPHLR